MHAVRKSVLLPYSDRKMYELVERVEDYPKFLPWCGGSEVHRESDERVVATVLIDFRGLKQRFTTTNLQRPPESISMRLREGPFSRLDGEWRFRALAPVFDHIARSFIDAFVRRADQVYGGMS